MNLFGYCRGARLVSRVSPFSWSMGSGWTISNLSSETAKLSANSQTLLKRQIKLRVLPSSSVQFLHFSSDASKSPLSKEHFDKIVKNNKVVVFMKGVPEEPRCGFSNAVVQIFRMHGVSKYDSHNVLEDENIRQGIKEYTNWPTIPQVFINGEFIGGCDILIEMHKNGELIEQLSKVGIKSALLEQEEAKNKDGSSSKK